jgi:hypothetical protein
MIPRGERFVGGIVVSQLFVLRILGSTLPQVQLVLLVYRPPVPSSVVEERRGQLVRLELIGCVKIVAWMLHRGLGETTVGTIVLEG